MLIRENFNCSLINLRCGFMEKLFAAKLHERKGAFHDNSSTTHDRGYASEESFFAYPRRLRAAGLEVRTPFQSVTGTTGPCEDSLIPGLPKERKKTRSKLHHHRRSGASFSLQNHTS